MKVQDRDQDRNQNRNQDTISRLYQLLIRGGFEYKEIIEKEGLMKSLKKEDLSRVINNEVNKTLLHEIAIHGLISSLDPKLLDKSNLLSEDKNEQCPLSNSIRYKCLDQIPKEFITKETLALNSRKSSLLHIATWAGELNHIPLDQLDNDNLCAKDFEDETPIGSVMEMIDAYESSKPEIIENYKKLLPSLLQKLNPQNLKEYNKFCSKNDLTKSLDFIKRELTKRNIEKLSNKKILNLDI